MTHSLLFAMVALVAACSSAPPPSSTPPVSLYARDQYVAGMLALHKQDYSEAEKTARAAMEDAPEFIEARVLLAESLLKLGKEPEGRAVLEEAQTLAPQRPEPVLLLGMLTELNGETHAAIDLYQAAREKYDTERLQREQMLDYVAANYLARGRLAGFEAVRQVQEQFGEDASTRQLHEEISRDNRKWFLQRVMPAEKKPGTVPPPAEEGQDTDAQ